MQQMESRADENSSRDRDGVEALAPREILEDVELAHRFVRTDEVLSVAPKMRRMSGGAVLHRSDEWLTGLRFSRDRKLALALMDGI